MVVNIMSTGNEKNLVGMKEIAAYVRRSHDTTLKMIRVEGLPAKKILGNWVSSTEQLDAWIKAKTRGGQKSRQAEKRPVSNQKATVSA